MRTIIKKERIKPVIVGTILIVALIVDLIIFYTVTDRPLGLSPSNLSAGPRINTNAQAEPAARANIIPGEPFYLVPKMTFQPVQNNSTGKINVIGYGRTSDSLYLLVRLGESIDLSLKKGWGKAFQLIDSNGNNYLYDSYSLPAGVHLYDPLVDLPDDLRANLTLTDQGKKDLYLHFPDFPEKATPVQLRVIEAFQGNSPANPGIIYHDISFFPAGDPEEKEPIAALTSLDRQLDVLQPLPVPNGELTISLNNLWIDENLFPCLSFTPTGNLSNAYLVDCVLIDSSGLNYNWLQLENPVPLTADIESQIIFERLPDKTSIESVWFKISVDDRELELTADIL